nr:MAG TPA: hypothetical protein [Bacteriophage sp.]
MVKSLETIRIFCHLFNVRQPVNFFTCSFLK